MSKQLLCVTIAVLALAAVTASQSSTESTPSTDATPSSTSAPWWNSPCPLPPNDLHPSHANKTSFGTWMKKFGKNFKLNEIEKRFKTWKENVKKVFDHNQGFHSGNHTWWQAVNEFAAHTVEDLKKDGYMGMNINQSMAGTGKRSEHAKRFAPSWIDWGQRSAVTSVKNQAGCGDCWAFSVTASIEGSRAIQTSFGINDLSEQNLLDCNDINGGCNGGDPIAAHRWASANGLTGYDNYPYSANQGGCQNRGGPWVHCNNVETVYSGNDDDLVNQVAAGPTAVGIHVTDAFSRYGGGVYDEGCPHDINHGVTVTGYARNCQNTGVDCYIVKNQWGTGYGTNGYLLMKLGSNLCNIAGYASRADQCW